MIKLNNISKKYIMGEVTVEALKTTSLEINNGELLVVLGPSGSGKSTLLNIIGGMDLPTTGELYFKEKNISEVSEKALTLYRRNEIGFVFQFFNLISDLTAKENIEIAANLVKNPLPVEDVLQEVGLEDRMHHFPSQLSGGEQQRVSIARAIVKKPSLLLCDEPTGALDHKTGKKILSLLTKINRERNSTVVIVTHNTAIGNITNRIVRMKSGAIESIDENFSPVSPERIEW